jgi:exo-beta-1,3-glucanase (GH17 family)
MSRRIFCLDCLLATCVLLAFVGHSSLVSAQEKTEQQTTFEIRDFKPADARNWRGNGISYGPYRDGQGPDLGEPTKEQISEDLKILAADGWQMIRLYGTEPFARKTCEVIHEEKLPLKVMAGAWVATEKDIPERKKENQGQVDRAIKLAIEYPEIVVAVSIGNESQVFWSFHKVEQATLIEYIRRARGQIKQPVTVADDFLFWTNEESKKVAAELDFIVTHSYALWHGKQLKEAMDFTKEKYQDVRKMHPDKLIVIGENGWATDKSATGDQSTRIKGVVGEDEQQQFFDAYIPWLQSEKISYFYFSAFDENWKGGPDPHEVEKHWGLFRADRSRKKAIEQRAGSVIK